MVAGLEIVNGEVDILTAVLAGPELYRVLGEHQRKTPQFQLWIDRLKNGSAIVGNRFLNSY